MMAMEVVNAFGTPERPKRDRIPKQRVVEWSQSEDIDTLGALYGYVSDPTYASRVSPALSADEFVSLAIKYFEWCLRENPDSKFANSRYEAGWELVGLFAGLWKDLQTPRDECERLKTWLADLYRSADEDLRRCIVDATLEHLFEDRGIAKYFADWKGDPLLGQAYREALEWSARGGTSPLTSKASDADD